jgi:hypothetical protein
VSPVACFLLVPSGDEVATELRSSPVWVRADGQPGRYVLGATHGGVPTAPPGAMWFAEWMSDLAGGAFLGGRPADGWLVVRLPNGHDWMPDTRASNCTLPDDNDHRCWVRHGAPPNVTVDKNGRTCAAGAGSIASGSYHGFLQAGQLV